MLLGAAGMVPLPLAGQHYGELLPARRCALTEAGIRLGGHRYDDTCLDEHRGRGQRREVHHHPYDIRQVFIRLPDGLLHAIPWAEGEHTLHPFDEMARRRISGVLERRGPRTQPGSETTDHMSGATRTGERAAVHGIAGGMVHDACEDADEDDAGDQAARESGGFGVWDAHAEAEQW